MKDKLPYFLIRISERFVRILPFGILSALSAFMAVILHRVIRYRRKTALDNLTMCFPDKSSEQLKRMLPQVYLNITDVLIETIKAFSTSPAALLKYIEPPIQAELDHYHAHYRGAILATAHLTNWEWCGYMLPEILHDPGIAVYRPIKNPHVDALMRGHRLKSRMDIVPMRQIVKQLASGAAGNHFVLLIADQSPDPGTAQWEDFFGIKTPFFKGPAVLAHRYDLPIYFVRLERIKRHRYRMHLEPLCMYPAAHDAASLLRMYIGALELHLRENPPFWLWTHKRWKHKPPQKQISE